MAEALEFVHMISDVNRFGGRVMIAVVFQDESVFGGDFGGGEVVVAAEGLDQVPGVDAGPVAGIDVVFGALATKWRRLWRIGWIFSGSKRAAIGSMLCVLRAAAIPCIALQRFLPVFVPSGDCQALHICREASLLLAWRGEA